MNSCATYKYMIVIFGFVLLFSLVGSSATIVDDSQTNDAIIFDSPVMENNQLLSADTDDFNITTDTTLSDSTLSLERGISVQSSSTLVLDNMTIIMNGGNYATCYIEIQTGSTIVIDDCHVYLNVSSTNPYSFYWYTDSHGNITDSTIENSGFLIYKADFIMIYNNTINSVESLNFRDSHNCTVELNVITTQNTRGIDYYYGSEYCHNMTIVRNEFYGCSQAIVGYGDNAYIGHNYILQTLSYGIICSYGDSCIIEWNTIEDPGTYGISMSVLTNFQLRGNTITEAGGDSIWLSNCDNGVIEHNIVSGGNYHALYLNSLCQNGDIYNNTLIKSRLDGLVLDGADGWDVWFNVFYWNENRNIEITSGSTGITLDKGGIGNFWGPAGPDNQSYYYDGPDSSTDWIGSESYYVYSGPTLMAQDDYPLLLSLTQYFAIQPTTISLPMYIGGEVFCLAENIEVQQGIIVLPDSYLFFVGTTVNITTGGSYWQTIEVQSGGHLILWDNATLTSDQTTSTYGFALRANSHLYLSNATIRRAGYPNGYQDPAFKVNITSAVLEDLLITDSFLGLYIKGADGLTISDVHFANCTWGIWADSNDLSLQGFTFDNVGTAIESSITSNLTIRDCDFEGVNNYGLYFAAVDECAIYNNRFVDITTCIRLNSLCSDNEIYMNFFSGETTYLIDDGTGNSMHNGTHGNFYLDNPVLDNDGDFIGDTTYSSHGVTDPYSYMIWGILPTPTGWEVTSTTYCLGVNYTISGDVNIYDGGALFVYGATFWFDCSYDQEFGIEVQTDGILEFYEGSIRAFDTPKYTILANPDSNITVSGTTIEGVYGFTVQTNSTNLSHVTISNAHNGLILEGGNLHGFTIQYINVTSAENIAIGLQICSDIILDHCEVYNSLYGVFIVESDNILIWDLIGESITNEGVYLELCNGINMSGGGLFDCDWGIYAFNSNDGFLANVDFTSMSAGVEFELCTNWDLTSVAIQECDAALVFDRSSLITMRSCDIVDCSQCFSFDFTNSNHADHDIDSSNTYDGKPIFYLAGQTGGIETGWDTNCFTLVYCTDVTINASTIHGNEALFYELDGCVIENSSFSNWLSFQYCSDMIFWGNDFSGSENIRIWQDGSCSNITFTLNAFWTSYSFVASGFNLNGSDYGNYWYDYPHDWVDDNSDGILDTPFLDVDLTMDDWYPLIVGPRTFDLVLEISSPEDGALVSGTIQVSASVTALIGILYEGTPSAIVNLGYNGIIVDSGGIRTIEYDLNSALAPDGNRNITLSATAGGEPLRLWSTYITVFVDNTAPDVVITPVNNTVWSDTELSTYVHANDSDSGMQWLLVYVDGVLQENETSMTDFISHTFPVALSIERSYNVTVVAINDAGMSVTITRIFWYDASDPVLSSPADISITEGSSETITWTVTEFTPEYYNISLGGTVVRHQVYVIGQSLDGDTIDYDIPTDLDAGHYTISFYIIDRVGNTITDYVSVTVTEATATTTTTTTITTTTTSSSTPPPNGGTMMLIVIGVGAVGVVGVILVILFIKKKQVG